MTTYTLTPGGVAAYLAVSKDGAAPISAIFMSHEKGVVIGLHDLPMASSDLPQVVQDSINAHFKHVFSLEHETWQADFLWSRRTPSPRAVYCDAAQPWTIEVPE